MTPRQATCVAIGGRGLMIEGTPGSGKSSLALALIDRGAVLVGDDSVLLEVREGQLLAHPHRATAGLMEVRGLGLLRFATCAAVPVALLLRLEESAPRFIEEAALCDVEGIPLPLVTLYADTPVLHLRAELALQHFGLSLG